MPCGRARGRIGIRASRVLRRHRRGRPRGRTSGWVFPQRDDLKRACWGIRQSRIVVCPTVWWCIRFGVNRGLRKLNTLPVLRCPLSRAFTEEDVSRGRLLSCSCQAGACESRLAPVLSSEIGSGTGIRTLNLAVNRSLRLANLRTGVGRDCRSRLLEDRQLAACRQAQPGILESVQ